MESLYHALWSRIGGRPWTYMLRDTWHKFEGLWIIGLVAVGAVLGRCLWGLVFWLLAVFAIGAGAALIGGEEAQGTMDLLLSYPIRRWRVVAEKFAALVVATVLIIVIALACVLICVRIIWSTTSC